MTADVRKAVRNSVSGQADRCKALEANPPSEEGNGCPLLSSIPLLLEQPPEDYTAYVEKR